MNAKLLTKSRLFVKRNASTILTFAGAAGAITTTVMAVKATPKALMLLEQAKEEKGEELTKLEKVQAAGTVYIPTIISGAATLACIFGANALNKRQQAALMSAYALLDNSYKEYKKKVEELYGEEVDLHIRKEIAKDKLLESDISLSEDDDKLLFYDEFSNRYFRATLADVIQAEYNINRKLTSFAGAYLNEFYDYLDIPRVDYGDYLGWSQPMMYDMHWDGWLDFNHEKVIMDDGLECYIITMSSEPVPDFDEY